MYDRALAGCEKALGLNHPSTLIIVKALGNLYADQGRVGKVGENVSSGPHWDRESIRT